MIPLVLGVLLGIAGLDERLSTPSLSVSGFPSYSLRAKGGGKDTAGGEGRGSVGGRGADHEVHPVT